MESADRVKSFAKVALVLMAVLALVLALNKLVPLLWISRNLLRADVGRTPVDIGTAWLTLLTPTALAAIAICLSHLREAIAKRICRPVDNVSATWEPAAFRVAFIFAGVLILSWAVYNLAGVGERIVQLIYDDVPQGWEALAWDGLWVSLASSLSKLVIGGYLLCGASAILRWQLRRIPSGGCCETELATGSHSDRSELPWTRLGLVLLGVLAVGLANEHSSGFVRLLGMPPLDPRNSDMYWHGLAIFVIPFLIVRKRPTRC